MEIFCSSIHLVKAYQGSEKKFAEFLCMAFLLDCFVKDLSNKQSNSRFINISRDGLIRIKAFDFLNAIYIGMYAMINYKINQRERLIERNLTFARLASDSIDDITLQTKQLSEHGNNNGSVTIFNKPEDDTPRFMQHGGKLISL